MLTPCWPPATLWSISYILMSPGWLWLGPEGSVNPIPSSARTENSCGKPVTDRLNNVFVQPSFVFTSPSGWRTSLCQIHFPKSFLKQSHFLLQLPFADALSNMYFGRWKNLMIKGTPSDFHLNCLNLTLIFPLFISHLLLSEFAATVFFLWFYLHVFPFHSHSLYSFLCSFSFLPSLFSFNCMVCSVPFLVDCTCGSWRPYSDCYQWMCTCF